MTCNSSTSAGAAEVPEGFHADSLEASLTVKDLERRARTVVQQPCAGGRVARSLRAIP